jgi:hypothetical protein
MLDAGRKFFLFFFDMVKILGAHSCRHKSIIKLPSRWWFNDLRKFPSGQHMY